MTLELIEDTDSASRSGHAAPDLVLSPKALSAPAPLVDLPPPESARADPLEYSRMAGRYLGQITARVERAWVRPRAPIEQGSFACRVRITQDGVGDVKAVELRRCNGDQRWKVSLVNAIESASPLPAPPDPRVFRRLVALDFVSPTYAPGDRSDGFEPEGAALAGGATPDASAELRSNVLDQLRAVRMGKAVSVDLRITGSGSSTPAPGSGAPPSTAPDPANPPLR